MEIDWEPGIMLIKHYGPWVIGVTIMAWAITKGFCSVEQPPRRNTK